MELGLTGKRALVTAASRGLGRAAALSLGREGARVALASRNTAALEEVAADIAAQGGPEAFPLAMDVTDPAQVEAGVAAAVARFGGLDILVANGPGPAAGGFSDLDLDAWRRALDEVVISMVALAQQVVPVMRAGGGGRILFITTVGVKVVQPKMVLSNATRLAVLGLAKTLSEEFGADDILVNALCPGPIATDRMRELIADTQARENLSESQAEAVWLDEVPLGRMGRPEDFGDLVAVLCSQAGAFVTGAALAVDGGKSRAY